MKATLLDRLTPTAVGVVSRGWVIDEVTQHSDLSDAERARLVDALSSYEPPRQHGLRNTFIAWAVLIFTTMIFNALDWPGWAGFVLALVALVAVARVLAVRTLRWRLAQWMQARR
jgi:hypothetical protein